MKKLKLVPHLILVCVLVGSFSVGVLASNSIEEIQAFLNYGIAVNLNGKTQTMYDANGERVYPINYRGTTYVPVRAVSNMFGVDVEWDEVNNTVWLGDKNSTNSSDISFKTFMYDGGSLTYDVGGTAKVEKLSITNIEKTFLDGKIKVTYEIIGTIKGYDYFTLDLKCYDSEGFLLESTRIGHNVSDGERFKLIGSVFISEKTVRIEFSNK